MALTCHIDDFFSESEPHEGLAWYFNVKCLARMPGRGAILQDVCVVES